MSLDPTAKLAIVIPTFRFDPLARSALRQGAAIGCDDIRVHIADNSENPVKHAFLEDLAARGANVVVTCHRENIGPEANWSFLIKAQTAPYVCIAADDDSFGGDYFRAGLDLALADPGCSAASGLHLSIAHMEGCELPYVHSPAERREAAPLDRISRYGGENTMAYTVSRHSIVAAYADYVAANPLKCPFSDVMLAFHLLSIGTYRMDRQGYAYVYNNTNWQTNESYVRSNASYYKALGLPPGLGQLTRLHMAVVFAHFFSSKFRSPDLAEDQAEAIAAHLFQRYRAEFKDINYKLFGADIDALFAGQPDATDAFRRLLATRYDRLAPIFDDFARVVAMFAPDVARRYRDFQTATLLPRAGAIALPAEPGPWAKLGRRARRVVGLGG